MNSVSTGNWMDCFLGGSRYLHHHIHGLKTSSRSNLCVLSVLAICVYGAVFGWETSLSHAQEISNVSPNARVSLLGDQQGTLQSYQILRWPKHFFTHRFLSQFLISLPVFG